MNKIKEILNKMENKTIQSKEVLGIFNYISLALLIVFFIINKAYPFFTKNMYDSFNNNVVLTQYVITSYFINYNNGFITRGLIGSFFNLFPNEIFINSVFVINSILIFVIVFYCFIQYLKAERKAKALPFAFFIPILTYFMYNSLGRLELYLFLIFILIIEIFYSKNVSNIFKLLLITILSCIGILIHQVFVFMVMPFVFLIFFENRKYKEIVFYVFVCFIVFCICYLFGKQDFEIIYTSVFKKVNDVNFYNYYKDEHGCSLSSAKNDMDAMLQLEFLYPFYKHIFYLKKDIVIHIILFFIGFIIVLFPLYLVDKALNNYFKDEKIYKYNKYKMYKIFLLVANIILFVFAIDYERWLVSFFVISNLTALKIFNKENVNE